MSKLIKQGGRIAKTLLFRLLTHRAAGFLTKPFVILELLDKALAKVEDYSSTRAFAKDAGKNLRHLFQMVGYFALGKYRNVATKNIILSIAVILYFLSPVDIIPDVLPFIGLLDDVSLLAWLISAINEELEKFEQWKDTEEKETITIADSDEQEELSDGKSAVAVQN